MKHPVLRVMCADAPGLVSAITGLLAQDGCNILRNDEFVDIESGMFFMRTLFVNGTQGLADLAARLVAVLPVGAVVSLQKPRPKRIVICATNEYHCLGDLLLRHHFGDLNAQILAVISNHAVLGDLVGRFGIPFHHVPHDDVTREDHEDAVMAHLAPYDVDYIVLAKYMRILSEKIVDRYAGKLINIHHSFLPAFIGAKPYHQAYERGVKMIGATAHFVTSALDEGPIIVQQVINIGHNDTAASMAQAGREVETQTLAHALQAVFDDRVFINGHKTVVF